MRRALVIAAIVALGASSIAWSQPRAGDPQQDRRDAVKRKIRGLRAAMLSDELRLDDKALARLLPVLARWDDQAEKLVEQRVDIQRRLEAVQVRGGDPRSIDRLIDEAVANQKALWGLEEQRLADLRKILTPPQVARLLVVLPEFERRIHDQLRRATRRGASRCDRLDDLDADDATPPRRR
jgi:hypothetical protein